MPFLCPTNSVKALKVRSMKQWQNDNINDHDAVSNLRWGSGNNIHTKALLTCFFKLFTVSRVFSIAVSSSWLLDDTLAFALFASSWHINTHTHMYVHTHTLFLPAGLTHYRVLSKATQLTYSLLVYLMNCILLLLHPLNGLLSRITWVSTRKVKPVWI